MKYIRLISNLVQEIIFDENPQLPGIPIEERYTPDFLAQLIPVADDVPVEQNWSYDEGMGNFTPPPESVVHNQEEEAST